MYWPNHEGEERVAKFALSPPSVCLCYNMTMFTKHFFKTLIMFSGIIMIGLIGAYLVSYFDRDGKSEAVNAENQVAK